MIGSGRDFKMSNIFQNLPEVRWRGNAHGYISAQEAQPVLNQYTLSGVNRNLYSLKRNLC